MIVWTVSLVTNVKQILMIALESFVTMVEHVKMGSTLFPITVQLDSLELTVKQILMVVMESSAITLRPAKMGQILSPVTAKKDSLGNNVKLILMTVKMESKFIPVFAQVVLKRFNVSAHY